MKPSTLLILFIALTVCHRAHGGWIRLRRVWNAVRRAVSTYTTVKTILGAAALLGRKRDLSEFDKNLDGLVDESELADVFTTREARQVLEMADKNLDSKVTMDEFQQMITELTKMQDNN